MGESLAPPSFIKRLDFETQAGPCGCTVITFPGRCAIAVPCDRHVGKVVVTMTPKE